ncbi:MAG: hypothetical protein IPL91_01615 [Hyphomicrobium sp.]|nr:hypothetical protein [Hyphomicrobium sp.]
MSSLKAGAMLSLFSGYSMEDAMRVAPKHEATSYDHYYPAASQPASLAAVDLNVGAVRKQGAAVARIFNQASQLMPYVLRSAFCGH